MKIDVVNMQFDNTQNYVINNCPNLSNENSCSETILQICPMKINVINNGPNLSNENACYKHAV
jgi:hypothetical protein